MIEGEKELSEKVGSERPSVLIVDDNKENLAVLSKMLGENGFEVRAAIGFSEERARILAPERRPQLFAHPVQGVNQPVKLAIPPRALRGAACPEAEVPPPVGASKAPCWTPIQRKKGSQDNCFQSAQAFRLSLTGPP